MWTDILKKKKLKSQDTSLSPAFSDSVDIVDVVLAALELIILASFQILRRNMSLLETYLLSITHT